MTNLPPNPGASPGSAPGPRPRKIAFLLPNLEAGGTERHTLSLARRLDGGR